MVLLPLKLATNSDKFFLNSELINLGKLARNNLPLPEGFIVTPPELILKTVLIHSENLKARVFEQNLTLLTADIKKIPIPQDLEKLSSKKTQYLVGKKPLLTIEAVWKELIEVWLKQLENGLWRRGFSEKLTEDLDPQIIWTLPLSDKRLKKNQLVFADSFWDKEIENMVIKSEVKLSPSILNQIDKLSLKSEKLLFLPHIYQFIITDQLYLVNIKPQTHKIPGSSALELTLPPKKIDQIKRSSVKIYWNLSVGFTVPTTLDGIIIDAQNLTDFDSLFFKLSETSLSFPHKQIIFKLPDLLENPQFRDKYLETLTFFIYQRNLANIDLCLSGLKSTPNLGEMIKSLNNHNLVGNGVSKIIIEFTIPENFINLGSYLTFNLKGVIGNLDSLQSYLNGSQSVYTQTLLSFLKPYFKLLHQHHLPIITAGELTLHPEVLDFLVENGIWGVVSNNLIEAESLPNHLNWVEERVVKKRLD